MNPFGRPVRPIHVAGVLAGLVALGAIAALGTGIHDNTARASSPEEAGEWPARQFASADGLPVGDSVRARAPADAVPAGAVRVPIDVERSTLLWRGSKLRRRRHHSGTVRLLEGHLLRCGPAVCGGRFIVNMTTIQVTDIPPDQPEPRQQLTDHLKSDDFFSSRRYPTAEFVLTDVRATRAGAYRVAGQLRIRDVTRAIRFDATAFDASAPANAGVPEGAAGIPAVIEASFRIDRQEWGISYRFDPIRNTIVDDEVDFLLSLRVER